MRYLLDTNILSELRKRQRGSTRVRAWFESAAASVGKDIFYMKVSTFGMSAALASVAGSLFAYYLSYVGADSFQISETVLILSMVVVGLGFFWIAFDENNQAWHDKIAGTVVVRVPKGVPLV